MSGCCDVNPDKGLPVGFPLRAGNSADQQCTLPVNPRYTGIGPTDHGRQWRIPQMARAPKIRINRRESGSSAAASRRLKEYRVETPRPDLVVLRVGERAADLRVLAKERASGIVAKMAKVMTKPGLTRAQIFQGTSGKVYAYSVYSKDPSKVVREDVSGHKILGKFVSGRFRPSSSSRTL